MKKFLALAGAFVVALTAPVALGAATRYYAGGFEPGGTLEFKLEVTNNGKKVRGFKFAGFPVECDSGPNTASGRIGFGLKVSNDRFEADAVNDAQTARLRVEGEFKGGGKAKGILRLRGTEVNVDNPPLRGVDHCSSPRTEWTASVVH